MSNPFQFHVPPHIADSLLPHDDVPAALARDMDLEDFLAVIRKHIPLVTFHLEGAVALGSFAAPPIISNRTVWAWALQLTVTGTSDTDVDLVVNGAAVDTLTLGSGVDFAVNRWPIDGGTLPPALLVPGDALTGEVTDAGTSAEDLVMSVWAL